MDLLELVIVLGIALIVLGPERLPEVLRTAGKILRELRAASNTVMRELSDVLEDGTSQANADSIEDPARATRRALPPPAAKPEDAPAAPSPPASTAAKPDPSADGPA